MSAPLWICADLGHANACELLARVSRVLHRVPATVWLRSPRGAGGASVASHAHRLRDLCTQRGARLFVGDRVDVALAASADGVHLPSASFPTAALRELPLRRSRAAHGIDAVRAERGDVDHLVVSPFGEVAGKGAALGFEGLRALCEAAGATEVIALGGIRSPHDARRCVDAGAYGISVRGALMDPGDPLPRCAELWSALRG